MDRIEWAERRYRQIVRAPDAEWLEVPVRNLEVWLKDTVAPLVGEYVRRPRFQELAAWPLRTLSPGSGTAARAAVEAVDESLVQCAGAIRKAFQSTRLQSALKQIISPKPMVTSQTTSIDGGAKSISRKTDQYDGLREMQAQIESIARRFWADLINPGDYWQPGTRWLLRKGIQTLSSGELVASLNPEIHRVGDFMTRCLDRRVGLLVEELKSAGHAILTATRSLGTRAPKVSMPIRSTLADVEARVSKLYAACWPEPEGVYRDSCITLVQAYVAYHPNPEIEWLGDAAAESSLGGQVFRHSVSHARKLEVTERVAAALADLRHIYAEDPPGQSALEEAIAKGGLVIAESLRELFWDRKKLNVAWSKRQWIFLCQLARKARLKADVLDKDVYDQVVSESTMATLCGRLKKHLPRELKKAIVPGSEPRSYRLDLSSHLVHFVKRSDTHSR